MSRTYNTTVNGVRVSVMGLTRHDWKKVASLTSIATALLAVTSSTAGIAATVASRRAVRAQGRSK